MHRRKRKHAETAGESSTADAEAAAEEAERKAACEARIAALQVEMAQLTRAAPCAHRTWSPLRSTRMHALTSSVPPHAGRA